MTYNIMKSHFVNHDSGHKTVVVAVQKGKEVAEEIDRLLGGQEND